MHYSRREDENLIPNQFSTGANEKLEKSESEEDQSLHILRVGECFTIVKSYMDITRI